MGSDKNRQSELKWFATRAIMDRSYVQKYLGMYGFEHSRIESITSLFFFIYRKAGSYEPDSVPAISVKTLSILASFRDENVIYLAVDAE